MGQAGAAPVLQPGWGDRGWVGPPAKKEEDREGWGLFMGVGAEEEPQALEGCGPTSWPE